MINEEEKKLIRKYCLLPSLAKVCLAMVIPIGIVWLVLVMMNDIVFQADLYMWGLCCYLAIVAIYTVGFILCLTITRRGMRKEKWKKLAKKAQVELSRKDYSGQIAMTMGTKSAGHLLGMSDSSGAKKAGKVFEALAAVSSLATVIQMANEIRKNAILIAGVFAVDIPKVKKYMIPIILLPVIFLTAVYIPHFIAAKENADAGIAVASKSVYALQDSLQQDCDHVSIDDPKEKYRSNGYSVTGYLYSYEEPYNSYISVTVENDGLISQVRYCVDVDIQAGKDENLQKAEQDLLKLNVMLNDAHVKAQAHVLLKEYVLPENFKEQFSAGSYYEDFSFRKDEKVSINYMTDSEEEYDEYSQACIYFSIEL